VTYRGTENKAQFHALGDVQGGGTVTLEDGRSLLLAKATTVDFSPWAPDELARDPGEAEGKRVVEMFGASSKLEGTWRTFCLQPEQELLVLGCVDGPALVPCPGAHAVTLAPGGRAAARSWLAWHVAGFFGIALFFAMLPLGCLWLAMAHVREVVRTLGAHASGRTPAPSKSWRDGIVFAIVAIVLLVFAPSSAWDGFAMSWLFVAVTLLCTLYFATMLWRRLGNVSSALQIVASLDTSAVAAAAPGALRELGLRVPADAPTRSGPKRTTPVLLRFEIGDDHALDVPTIIPVEDASGRAALDMRGAMLDVVPIDLNVVTVQQACEHVESLGATQAESMALVRGLPTTKQEKGKTTEVTHTLSCKLVMAGDPLLVYGDVRRDLPGEAGLTGSETDYRSAGTVPVVHKGQTGMVVYVGHEADLRARLVRERRFLWPALVLFSAAWLATVAAAGWVLLA
jgi:hypothetical protein